MMKGLKTKEEPLVSVIIPTKNSGTYLDICIKSIKNQSYRNIEVILVDGNSTDNTLTTAKRYKAKVFQFDPRLPKGKFDAPHRRNFGVKKSKGEFIYYADADYELTKNVVKKCVLECDKGYAAVNTPLETIGEGIWTRAKNLERRAYFGDDTVEVPRFYKKSVWDEVGGLDESLGGGGDDWDIYQKLLDRGYKAGRVNDVVFHHEGKIKLGKLYRKAFMYGRDALKYLKKRPKNAIKSYFPIRPGYIRNWKQFINRPLDTLALIIVRTVEYSGGLIGIAYSLIHKND